MLPFIHRQAQAFAGAPGTRGTGACSSCGPFGCGEPTSFTCTMHGRVLGLELASCDRRVHSGGAGIMAPPDMKSEGRGKRRVVMREVGGRWTASSNDSAQDLEARGAASDGRCVDVLRRRWERAMGICAHACEFRWSSGKDHRSSVTRVRALSESGSSHAWGGGARARALARGAGEVRSVGRGMSAHRREVRTQVL